MKLAKKVRNDVLLIIAIGLLTALAGAFLKIEIGGGVMLSNQQSWEYGLAPTIVFFGLLLVVLGVCYSKAFPFVKWAIPLWLPIFFLAEELVIGKMSKTTLMEFMFLGLPILVIWLWSWYGVLKRPETIKHFQDRARCNS